MAVKLNLLPPSYTLTGPARQVVKIVRPVNVILLALFLIMVFGMGAFFIISSYSLKNLVSANTGLANQIQAQSNAEQQIVLLKDRLGTIGKIQTTPGINKNMANITPVLALITGNSLLSELDINPKDVKLSATFKSNSDLTNFIKSINSNDAFSAITLETFNYNPDLGYQTSISFTGK